MADKMKRIGFGQVEPNHLSAQRTAQIYAQLPANKNITVLENGQFVKYDLAHNEVNYTGKGEWMLVFNEVKLYDGWRETYKDFAMQEKNYTDGSDDITHDGYGPFPGKMYPRVFKTNVGDIFTTNCLKTANVDGKAVVEMEELEVGNILAPNAEGYLAKVESATGMAWEVAKVTTMPDGQAAVKIVRIA